MLHLNANTTRRTAARHSTRRPAARDSTRRTAELSSAGLAHRCNWGAAAEASRVACACIHFHHTEYKIVNAYRAYTAIVSRNIHLSGKFCRGDEMSTLVTTLYSMMSHRATRSTTTSLGSTERRWGGIPCQKCSRKFST